MKNRDAAWPILHSSFFIFSSPKEFLDLGGDGASFSLSGQPLGGCAHHLAHVFGTGSTHFGDDFLLGR